MSVLVVDTDQAFKDSIVNLLLACGFEKFEMASSTEEAEEKISESFFDIVLVDLFMPQMNGLHFAQKLGKRMPTTKVFLLIEDQLQPALNDGRQAKLNVPTILKSFVSRNLPQLLSEKSMFVDALRDLSN